MDSLDKISAEWDEMASDWDKMAFEYRDIMEKEIWIHTGLDHTSSTAAPLKIVDFGCGTGLMTEAFMKNTQGQEDAPKHTILALDASPKMVEKVREKIAANKKHWGDDGAVVAHHGYLSHFEESFSQEAKDYIKEHCMGKMDLIVASSVLNFVPKEHLDATMKALASLLKPNGMLFHTDWPKDDEKAPDGFTTESAKEMYSMGNLEYKSSTVITRNMFETEAKVFVGVAIKK
mmetsp:Transcript_6949/g.10623  ORF Transcript_6949/g.10623 Transcript_6949/m.10623 type:complete len:232 (+) Transcript_6949:261-956(+)